MAIYAIGDIQGCYESLLRLLERLNFDTSSDRIWFVGDLVNRGPHSLQTLRFVKSMGDHAVCVLGNHDLHLLAIWQQLHRHFKNSDTLAPIFKAADGEDLLTWLLYRPLIHHDPALSLTMVHAGIPPHWSISEAQQRAAEVEAVLQSRECYHFLTAMYGNKPDNWHDDLKGDDRLRYIVNALTRTRYIHPDGKLDFKIKSAPGAPQQGKPEPWYRIKHRKSRHDRIVFGHWSTLGYYHDHNVFGVDSGCLWGGQLTALRIDVDPPQAIHYHCPQAVPPKG
ncbi:MAG: symmetrical bis(5'-nucleosyl)-tetraphosphatase [Gammaproteobacteria bacterium]|nr:symmetrical bis(5'-nucleosyl)-tetraphosphatase [Gammaproteobacteria bacterium]